MSKVKLGNVERGCTGKIKTAAYVAAKAAKKETADKNAEDVVKWARIKAVLVKLAMDPFLSGPCGEMLFIEKPAKISASEFAAAERLHGVLDDYDRLVLGVRRGAKAQDVNAVHGASLADETPESSVKRAAVKFMEAEKMMGMGGPGVAGACKALVRGEDWQHRIDLSIAGLRALAVGWGLSDVPQQKIKRAVDIVLLGRVAA